jgi:hypothetical protein
MKLFKTAVNNAKTHDIIYSLCIAAPAAIAQAKKFNLPEVIGLTGGNLQNDATLTGKWIRQNVKYKIDTFKNQNIQLPSAILKQKDPKIDCKSISLLYLAIMEAAGYNGGFRFAGYKGKNFTHVYNFFVNQNKIYTFDACISNLQEVKRHTILKDMRVNYLAGVPTMINEEVMISQPTAAELMRDDRVLSINGIGKKRKPLFGGVKKFFNKLKPGGGFKPVKTIGLAPARGSFLVLVNLNFRGLAKKLNKLKLKNATKYAEFWTKLGGDVSKLDQAVNKGKNKKAFAGGGIKGIGEDAAAAPEGANVGEIMKIVSQALPIAGGIIAALKKLFQKEKIEDDAEDTPIDEGIDPETPLSPEAEPGEPVVPNDPASDTAAEYIQKGIKFIEGITNKPPKLIPKGKPSKQTGADKVEATDKTPFSFTPSPLMLGVGAAAIVGIYLLTKKK